MLPNIGESPVKIKDIQNLHSAETIAQLFARLGYQSDLHADAQAATPEHIHTKPELLNQIRDFHQLAHWEDETGSAFYVYLYVVPKITISLTKNIFQDLKKRQADFLVVLADESYDTIDILYVDRTFISTINDKKREQAHDVQFAFPSENAQDPAALTVSQARMRVRSIDRRKPDAVDCRVLNRFQLSKQRKSIATHCIVLSGAFDIAEWSEQYFNNRALFSDHYLMKILPTLENGEWKEAISATNAGRLNQVHNSLRGQYDDASDTYREKSGPELRKNLLKPVLSELDFAFEEASKLFVEGERQLDFRLFTKDASGQAAEKAAICLAYRWGRNLDGYEDDDPEQPDPDGTTHENPGAVVISLMDQEQVDWAFLTNGKVWRLYSAKTHSRATNYYEIDLEETLNIPREQTEGLTHAFLYFWLLFRAEAFLPKTRADGGEAHSFLNWLLRESAEYALALGDSLKKRIFEEIFAHFAEGLVHDAQHKRALPTTAQLAALSVDERDKLLKPFFNATLTFLYRLLVLLYAESRNLLPIHERHGYWPHSLSSLKHQIADYAGKNRVQGDRKISESKEYTEEGFACYQRLQTLFAAIDLGNEELNVPTYNGGLFITRSPFEAEISDPCEDWGGLTEQHGPEEIAAFILASYRISDRHLALGLDKLARDEDKSHELVMIDYKSLGVRQLGSIYEGLLEFKLRIAVEEMAIVKDKVIPLQEAEGAGTYRRGKTPTITEKKAYIENDRHERKATGSYYTPDYIVEYIVEQTVGPVLDEKEQKLKEKFRRIEEAVAQRQRENRMLAQRGQKVNAREIERIYERANAQDLVEEFFDIKVLDPAMGSGHFPVEAVDYITRRMLKFLDQHPNNPVRYELKKLERTIAEDVERQKVSIDRSKLTEINLLKRQVLKRCIYGVDVNPMAVELAKVSMWLDSFTIGAPFSFLDHHLKCGNSLIGADIEEARNAGQIKEGGNTDKTVQQLSLTILSDNDFWASALLSAEGMIRISKLTDVTPAQARESQEAFTHANDAIFPLKRVLDVYLSRYFSNPPFQRRKDKAVVDKALDFIRTKQAKEWARTGKLDKLNDEQLAVLENAKEDAQKHHFFHWQVEFPEVFIDLQHASLKSNPGFDAVIGNPPYVRQEGLGESKGAFQAIYKVYDSIADLYTYFIERGHVMLHQGGHFGMITANKFMRANYGAKLRAFLLEQAKLEKLIDFGDLPVFGEATAYPIITIFDKSERNGEPIEYTLVKSLQLESLPELIQRTASRMPESAFGNSSWSLSHTDKQVILDKLTARSVALERYMGNSKIRRGILTGFNEAFIIDQATRSKLIAADPKSAQIIKPFLMGEDVRRYTLNFQNRYLIWTYIGVSIKEYPAVYQHLQSHQSRLESRWDKGNHWWELRHCDYYAEFEKPKIIYPVIAISNRFSFDTEGYYSNDKTFFIPTDSLYLLSILNSSTMYLFFRSELSKLRGGFLEYRAQTLVNTPIRRIAFTTPPAQRAAALVEAQQHYQTYLASAQLDARPDTPPPNI
jgi:hypothetical protein